MRLACLALVFSACASAAEAPDARVSAPVDDSTLFREIVITLDPDGTPLAVERPITAGLERAQNAAKLAGRAGPVPLVAVDSGCAVQSFWLYDQPNWVGNRLCLAGVGRIALHGICVRWSYVLHVCRETVDFDVRAGSYISGQEYGHLEYSLPGVIDASTVHAIPFGQCAAGTFDVTPEQMGVLQLDN